LARVVEEQYGGEMSHAPGAGAAGGLGFGLMAFCGATLCPGFELFAQHSGLEEQVAWAELLVTGEGSVDASTLMGKGVGQLAEMSRRRGRRCIALGGRLQLPGKDPFTIARALSEIASVEEAMKKPAIWLARLACMVARECPEA